MEKKKKTARLFGSYRGRDEIRSSIPYQRGSGRGVSGLGIGGFSGSSIKGLGALVSRAQLFSQKMWAEEVAADFRCTNNPKP